MSRPPGRTPYWTWLCIGALLTVVCIVIVTEGH